MPTPRKTRAREYLRVSQDRSGRARSTDEQHTDNAAAAVEQHWVLGQPYTDVGRSASRYARRAREGYDQLVADLQVDRFRGDVLILWEHSRGSRKVSEWVLLLELLEQRGVLVHVTSHRRTYDPSNARDRRSLLEDSVDAEYESSKISAQTKRAAAANAAAGLPAGRVPFGYKRRYDPQTRRLVAQEPEPTEAPLIRELFARIVAGHSLRAIAADLEQRGVVNGSGRPFSPQHLRSLLVNRAYVGERVHDPARRTRGSGKNRGAGFTTALGGERGAAAPRSTATVTKGQWPALVDRATFLQVQRILTAPDRKTTRPGRGIHLLSMIGTCAVCGGPLSVRYREKRATGPQYQCRNGGHVRVDQADLDKLAEDLMLGYLARPDVYTEVNTPADPSSELAEVRGRIGEARDLLDDLVDQVTAGVMTPVLAGKAEQKVLAELAHLSARESELSTPPVLRGLLRPGKDVKRRWKAAPMSTRRQVARLLLTVDVLGELRVERSPTPGHTPPIEDRVSWWRG